MNSDIGYSRWRDENRSALESLSDKKVFLMFSGGKDSSLTMDFISKAGKEFGFGFEAHAGAYPVHRYPDNEKKRIGSYWRKRDVEVIWHDMGETDDYIKHTPNPCLPCQKLRKKMLNSVLASSTQDWERLVLIICFSLWDIVSYSIEHILSDIFSDFDPGVGVEKNRRFAETAQRFYPLLKMKEGYTVFRPLIKYNNNDILKLIAQEGIPTLSIPCAFRGFRPKRILEGYYEKMGLCFKYNQVFDFARRSLNLPDASLYTSIDKDEYLLHLF
jgi:tRNA(Ile)-lysidine synthase TilS/MesJ